MIQRLHIKDFAIIDEIDIEGPKQGEVLVRMHATGVCPVSYTHLTLPTSDLV